ncbi:MAG: porin family protein [Mesorhizobium amorphae]|nr:MAG: porin family protein [Mesorhizobium amorphae]
MKRALLALPLLFAAAPAFAADAVVEEVMPIASVGEWTGFYAGVQLGGAFGGGDDALDISPFDFAGLVTAFTPPGAVGGSSFNGTGDFNSGFVGGVHVGYDHQFENNVILGAILDVSFTDISEQNQAFSRTPATYTIERDLDVLATLRARLGYAFAPRVMGYVTGGLAYGDVDFNYSQPGSAAIASTSGGQDSDFGYTVGAGIEGLVTEKVSLGIEYLYTNLGSNDFEANLTGGPFGGTGGAAGSNLDGTTLSAKDDFDFHTVQLKLSYRF